MTGFPWRAWCARILSFSCVLLFIVILLQLRCFHVTREWCCNHAASRSCQIKRVTRCAVKWKCACTKNRILSCRIDIGQRLHRESWHFTTHNLPRRLGYTMDHQSTVFRHGRWGHSWLLLKQLGLDIRMQLFNPVSERAGLCFLAPSLQIPMIAEPVRHEVARKATWHLHCRL